jgi:hypothetical protein
MNRLAILDSSLVFSGAGGRTLSLVIARLALERIGTPDLVLEVTALAGDLPIAASIDSGPAVAADPDAPGRPESGLIATKDRSVGPSREQRLPLDVPNGFDTDLTLTAERVVTARTQATGL